jgi:hypothetical protein
MRWPCRGLCQVPQGRKTRLIASRRGNLLGRCGVVTVITTGQATAATAPPPWTALVGRSVEKRQHHPALVERDVESLQRR